MTDIIARLEDWGSWASGHGRGGSISNPMWDHLAKGACMQQGWENFPAEIEQTERAIGQLKLYRPYLKKVIFHRYLYHFSPQKMAHIFRCHSDTVLNDLDKAHRWLNDYLEGLDSVKQSANIGLYHGRRILA